MTDNNDSYSGARDPEGAGNFDDSLNINVEETPVDNGIHWGWDLLIDAVIVVALCVAAVIAAPVSVIAAIGFGLAAAYVAWTSEHDSNVLTDSKRLLTTASIATLGSVRWLGMTGLVTGAGGLLLSGLMDWLNTDMSGLIILGVIILILWNEMRSEDAVIVTDDDESDKDMMTKS